MQYLTYGEYQTIGGILPGAAFNRTIDRACGIIDAETRHRVEHMAEVPQAVKACCRDLCELLHDATENKNVSSRSQTAGNVSESVSYKASDSAVLADDAERLIVDYLLGVTDDHGTPLLYKGGAK